MTEPITTAEAKRQLRLDDDDPGVTDVDATVVAARMTVEQYLNASIVTQARTHILDAFPDWEIVLPNGPVTSVTSISYVDTDGATQTVASHIRSEDTITPVFGAVWPDTRAQIGAVTITYVAGMMSGSPETLDEKDIKAAILLVLGDLWENREGQFVGVATSVNPTVERLLHYHRRELGI